jgi:hypothetical protein
MTLRCFDIVPVQRLLGTLQLYKCLRMVVTLSIAWFRERRKRDTPLKCIPVLRCHVWTHVERSEERVGVD